VAKSSDVILVHGAWADGSSWAKVIPLLAARGHSVTAVQLPLTSRGDDVAAVKRAISLASGPIIMAGHSYGGAVISEAGNDPKVETLVYIAAFAPDAGESSGSLGASVEPAPLGTELRPDAQRYLRLTQSGVSDSFAQDLTDTEKLALYSAQSPTAGAALGGTVSAPAWLEATSTTAALRRLAILRVAMLSHPKEVASLIAG
jgi:pimeloyl-ACP methyl ester carboxylesterase